MPQYTLKDFQTNRTIRIEANREPTQAEIAQIFREQTPPVEEPSAAPSPGVWETTKRGASALFEALGRPGELVSGTVAGALSPEQDWGRGWRAFTEPLIGGTQTESFGTVLREQLPEFTKAHPIVAGGLGLAADVVTDPLNLLGGAGVVRRGLIKGAQAVGVPTSVARAATLVPVGEAIQSRVVPKITETVTSRLPSSLVPNKALRSVMAGTISAADYKYLSSAEQKAITAEGMAQLQKIVDTHQLTDAEQTLLGRARGNRAMAAHVSADPRLAQAQQDFTTLFDQLRTKDIAASVLEDMRAIDPTTLATTPRRQQHLQQTVATMTPQDWTQLQAALQTTATGDVVNPAAISALPKPLKVLAEALVKGTRSGETVFQDLGTLRPILNPAGGIQGLEISTRQPQYLHQAMAPPPSIVEGAVIAARPSGQLKSALEKHLSVEEAIQQGFVPNIVESAKRRILDSARARSQTSFIQNVAASLSTTPQTGFRPLRQTTLNAMTAPMQQLYAGKFVPEAVAKELESNAIRLVDPEYLEGLPTRLMKTFKALVTTAQFPSHHLVNFMGNSANMYLAGMRPDEVSRFYAQAGVALARKQPTSRSLWAQYLTEAQSRNVIGTLTSEASDVVPQGPLTQTAELLTTGTYNPLSPEFVLYQKSRNFNQRFVEDPAKLALFAWERSRGKSVDEATLSVRKHLFDYSDLTDTEKRIFRHVIPFYTWTRKNFPLQLAATLERPVRLKNQERVLDLLTDLANADRETPANPADMAEYAQDPEFVTVPGVTTPEGDQVRTAVRLPMADLNWLTTDPEKLRERLAFQLTPAARIPAEWLLGRRLGTGEPLSSTRLVRPNAVQMLTGAGVMETPEGPRTTAYSRWLADQIPLPGAAVGRTVAATRDERESPPMLSELAMRLLGLSPQVLSPEHYAKAEDARRRAARAARAEQELYGSQD